MSTESLFFGQSARISLSTSEGVLPGFSAMAFSVQSPSELAPVLPSPREFGSTRHLQSIPRRASSRTNKDFLLRPKLSPKGKRKRGQACKLQFSPIFLPGQYRLRLPSMLRQGVLIVAHQSIDSPSEIRFNGTAASVVLRALG